MRLWLYLPAIFVLSLAAALARTMATLGSFNFDTGYYSEKTLIFAAEITMLLAMLVALTYPIFHKGIRLVASFEGGRTFVAAGISSVALLFVAFDFSRRVFGGKLVGANVKVGNIPIIEIIGVLCVIFALASILGFFLTALSTKREDQSRAWFTLCTVVFLILYSVYIYFNTKLPINAPGKLTDMTAYIVFALFFLFETRISLGRSIWPMYLSFGMAAVAMGVYSALPSLAVYLINGRLVSDSIYEITLTLALTVFAAARIIGCASLSDDSDAPMVSYIKESESARLIKSEEGEQTPDGQGLTDADKE
ncbi:MAG: hypothetical protein J6Q85_01965 [Clostridia bacterium]|nr:hypothetical protein [Clostridia bacterium]